MAGRRASNWAGRRRVVWNISGALSWCLRQPRCRRGPGCSACPAPAAAPVAAARHLLRRSSFAEAPPAPAEASPARGVPVAAAEHKEVALDQETFDRVLAELLEKGMMRRRRGAG
jgi:hypothetical protein